MFTPATAFTRRCVSERPRWARFTPYHFAAGAPLPLRNPTAPAVAKARARDQLAHKMNAKYGVWEGKAAEVVMGTTYSNDHWLFESRGNHLLLASGTAGRCPLCMSPFPHTHHGVPFP